MNRTLGIASVALGLAALLSCGKSAAPECIDNGQCGAGQACIEETCADVECLASSSCGLEQFCDQQAYVCKSGCEQDSDCMAGSTCNTDSHQCEEYGCRSTDLDCEFGEVCDEATGECKDAPGKHCDTCDDPYFGTGCGQNGWCATFDDSGTENYCLMQCDANKDDPCPRGYECAAVYQNDPTTYCFAWCPDVVQ